MANDTHLLWTEFSDRLRGFIAWRVANEADAEDILQEVFLRIHQRVDSVQHAERVSGWLFQITRNVIVDYYRAPRRRREITVDTPNEPAADLLEVGPSATAAHHDAMEVQQELAVCLRPMVEQLPAHYREAVILADLEGITQREAAGRLGLSISGMKSRVQRGRRSLKTMLHTCCQIQLDAGGRVTDYTARDGACTTCASRSS